VLPALGLRHAWRSLGAQARNFVVQPVDFLLLLGVGNVRTGVLSWSISKSRIGL